MKKAFSLSELLLALGIISVIATLMITTVVPLGDEKKNKTLANKAFLTLEEAYAMQIINDAGRDVTFATEFPLDSMTPDVNPVLPFYEKSGNAVQLSNGMIIYNDNFSDLFVDIDGVEGNTKSTLSNPPMACGNPDILRFVFEDSEIVPDYECGNAAEYFDYDEQALR